MIYTTLKWCQYLSGVCLIVFSFNACSQKSDHAGNVSETTNHISGTLELASGTPAVAARVKLFLHSGMPDTAQMLDEKETDSKGSFSFTDLKQGRYSLLAQHTESGTLWNLPQKIELSPTHSNNVMGVLQQPGYLHLTELNFPDSLGGTWEIVLNDQIRIPFYSSIDSFITIPSSDLHISIRVLNSDRANERVWAYDTLRIHSNDTFYLEQMQSFKLQAQNGTSLLLDDFEGDNLWSEIETSWWIFNDNSRGGQSTIGYADSDSKGIYCQGNETTDCAVKLNYSFTENIAPAFSGFGISPTPAGLAMLGDLSIVDTLKLRLKGTGLVQVEACITSAISDMINPECILLQDTIATEWDTLSLAWFDLGSLQDPANMFLNSDFLLLFHPVSNISTSGEIWIDDMEWILKP
jgi:hypothetical protein